MINSISSDYTTEFYGKDTHLVMLKCGAKLKACVDGYKRLRELLLEGNCFLPEVIGIPEKYEDKFTNCSKFVKIIAQNQKAVIIGKAR